MLLEKIAAWLLAPEDYTLGLALLGETGFKGFTLTILSKGDDAYNRTRLEAELRKWQESQTNSLPIGAAATRFSKENSEPVKFGLDYGVPGAQVVVVPKILTKSDDASGFQSPAEEPADVLNLKREIYSLMDERIEALAWIRAKEDLGNSPEACAIRLPYAILIKENTFKIDELYSRLDFFEEYGYLPPLANDQAVIVDDNKLLHNARSNVSRQKKKLERTDLTPQKREVAQAKFNQYSQEKARLEAKLSTSVTTSADE